MCGNEAIIIDEHDSDNNEKKQQEVETSNIIIEQIDGTCYTLTRLIAHWCSKNSMLYMEAILQINKLLILRISERLLLAVVWRCCFTKKLDLLSLSYSFWNFSFTLSNTFMLSIYLFFQIVWDHSLSENTSLVLQKMPLFVIHHAIIIVTHSAITSMIILLPSYYVVPLLS